MSQGALSVIDAPLLAERTGIRIGGRAIAELRIGARALEALPDLLERLGGRPAVLGRGTNILASDDELPLVLISLEDDELRVIGEEADRVLLRVEAGLGLPVLLAKTASLGLTGLEGLAGIPGNVGGAAAMNAGSFGVEIGTRVRSLELFSPHWGLVEKRADELHFTYRSCRLPEHESWFVISAVTLALEKGDKKAIRERMARVHAEKRQSQPIEAWSAGCVFKNPAPNAPAGRLIDEAGLKGKGVGGMRFSPLHANFLVNEGGGSFAQAMELMELARERVRALYGYELEAEVRIWR